MKLVVTDVSGLSKAPEREFELPIVKVGRESDQCHIVFDRVTWPMVSRYHSEFRCEAGKCLLFDANSTFGTFLNGQRVKGSAEVRTGALVQFGVGGPTLRIAIIETDASISQDKTTKRCLEMANQESKTNPFGIAQQNPTASGSQPLGWLEVQGMESSIHGRVELKSEVSLLGRDPSSVISFNSGAISRRHAEIRRSNDHFVLVDLSSYNGTFVNGTRISGPTLLYNNDCIQLGIDGSKIRLIDPENSALPEAGAFASLNTGPECVPFPVLELARDLAGFPHTVVAPADAGPGSQPQPVFDPRQAQPLLELVFRDKPYISVGRGEESDIRLDSLQVSLHHARLIKDQDSVLIEDKGSTNGVYINGKRIDHGRKKVDDDDVVQIGPFKLRVNPNGAICVFDTRAKTRIDVVNLNKVVTERSGKSRKLLDEVALSIQPNEFVGLLGASGAGKSTLMQALNGMSAPSSGRVLINELDLYRHLDSLKHSIGYVPQDDIIHRELTVERTLSYVAGLRLSRDVSKEEVDQIVDEVLEVTGLTERRDVPVASLSGGQRKRVSIAVELITKPAIIFLDEPTSGLDPATEEKIMNLFRQITETGRTVVLTTHNTANIRLFDKIVVLMHGKVVFYGEPAEALEHFQVNSFKQLYDVLETPVDVKAERHVSSSQLRLVDGKLKGTPVKEDTFETPADRWKNRYEASQLYQRNIVQPLQELNPTKEGQAIAHPRLRFGDAVRQWKTLTRRYFEILARDRINLLVLLGQAPVIALLTYLVINEEAPRDFPYFMLALIASWFGISIAAREIIRERPIYKRERMVNLGLLPYVGSKIFVLAFLVTAQCVLLFATLKILHFTHLTYLPGAYLGLPQLVVMILTGLVGIALGLLISGLVKTSQAATSLVPLLLIPQILFSGLNGVPKGIARMTGAAMPVTWSFDEMKRLSGLETLNEEGSIPKYMEGKADQESKRAQQAMEDFNREVSTNVADYNRRVEEYLINVRTNPGLARPEPPVLGKVPTPGDGPKHEDLKEFVSFTHPWGGIALNSIVLFLMLSFLIVGTVTILRVQDQ